jgi:hypothetical protein
LTIPVPALALAGAGHTYYLWALKEPFSPQARVFDPPLPNIHGGGLVCWGDNTPPNAHPRNAEKAWRLFFDSPFNSHLANGKTRRHKDDVRRLLVKLEGRARFPLRDLIADRGTLESNIDRLFK